MLNGRSLTPQSLNVKLGLPRKYHKGQAAIRHYANQTARPLWPLRRGPNFTISLNVKAVVAAFNQEKALVGAFSVITNLQMELFEALIINVFGNFTPSQTLFPR